MKLLILTQSVDLNNPILGFFHRWIEEFSKNFEFITIICLEKGEVDLPSNVKVLSLGKENGKSKIKYLYRFFKYIWQERNNYDNVFVHMNYEYVLLGWWLWMVKKKNIYLWYNHKKGDWKTKISVIFVKKIFFTSDESFFSLFKKSVQMPVGIDTNLFDFSLNLEDKQDFLSLGRISKVKNVDLIIKAYSLLEANFKKSLKIVGDPISKDDLYYYNDCKKLFPSLVSDGKIIFLNSVSNKESVNFFKNCDIFINATAAGSLDKTIFEAMSCGCLILISNKYFSKLLPENLFSKLYFKEGDFLDLANCLKKILKISQEEKKQIRQIMRNLVIENHSLEILNKKIKQQIL